MVNQHSVRVLQSVAAPGTTARFVSQVTYARFPDLEHTYFSWRNALCSRYDVVHIHWPEQFFIANSRWARLRSRLIYCSWMLRVFLLNTAMIRTIHNEASHESMSSVDRALGSLMDAFTDVFVRMSSATRQRDYGGDFIIPHGDYREPFQHIEHYNAIEGRILHFGMIRKYKGLDRLILAFQDLANPQLHLRVVGKPIDVELTQIVKSSAEQDPRISTLLEFVSDEVLVREFTQSQVVVLPYIEFENSGVMLVALSLNRRVIAPNTPVVQSISDEVGPGWVVTYDGEFSSETLRTALIELDRVCPDHPPQLTARSWQVVSTQYHDVYLYAASMQRSRVARILRSVSLLRRLNAG